MSRYIAKHITQSAKGEECTMNTPWCNYDPSTTVWAHLNDSFAGKGMGIKADDDAGFMCCSSCHSAYDGAIKTTDDFRANKDFYVLRAVIRSLKVLREKGVPR